MLAICVSIAHIFEKKNKQAACMTTNRYESMSDIEKVNVMAS